MRARTLAVIVGRWEQIKRRIEGPRHGACQSDPGVRTTCTEVSKENNKGSIFYLRDYPKTTFSDLPNSIVQDDMGAAMGYRSDCIADIIVDANKKYKITETED